MEYRIRANRNPVTDRYDFWLMREDGSGRQVLSGDSWVESDCYEKTRVSFSVSVSEFHEFLSPFMAQLEDTSGLRAHLSDLRLILDYLLKKG